MDVTISSTSASSISAKVISFPSKSWPIGLYKDTSLFDFFNERKYIKISLSIQQAQYVASFAPLFALKLSTPLIKPIVPIEIKSSLFSFVSSYFFTICATRRKLCSINLSLAIVSPASIASTYFFSSSLDNGWGNALFLIYETNTTYCFKKYVIIAKIVDICFLLSYIFIIVCLS